MKKKIIVAAIVIPVVIFLIAAIQGIIQSESSVNMIDHELIKDEDRYGRGQIRDMEILLKNKVTEEELYQLGNHLLSDKQDYERVWMFYYIEGDTSRAWATTHVDPEFELNFLGSTIEQDSLMRENLATKTPGNIIGAWKGQSDLMGWHCSLSKRDNVILFSWFFNNGSHSTDTVSITNNKFDMNSDKYGIIEDDGSLTFHSHIDGPFSILEKLDVE